MTTKKELLAMVAFTKFFKHYLLGREFILRTDHDSLRWLHNFHGLEGQLAHWVEQLASFQYCIIHRPGKQHGNADALSRLPSLVISEAQRTSEQSMRPSVTPTSVRTLQETLAQDPLHGGSREMAARPSLEPGALGVVRDEDLGGKELQRAQQRDPDIMLLIQLKTSVGDGGIETVCPAELRRFAGVWRQLQAPDGMLMRVPVVQGATSAGNQVVLPKPWCLLTFHSCIMNRRAAI